MNEVKESDKWKTPTWLMEVFKDYYDPVPPDHSEDYITSLNIPKGNLYINPPYSDPLPFVLKGIEQHKKFGIIVIFLLKMDSSTKWYKALVDANAHFLYFAERLHYSDSKDSPPFSSILAILNNK